MLGRRIAEYSDGILIREYVWMNDRPIAVLENGGLFLIRTDHIGRPILTTEVIGTQPQVVWEARYLPFGGVEVLTGGTGTDIRFPGQWFQSEHGLHQNWMRDYDPVTGRYLQADPLGLVDGASVYGYALQNPMRYTDFLGLGTSAVEGLGWWPEGFSMPSIGGVARNAGRLCVRALGGVAVGVLWPTPVADGTCGPDQCGNIVFNEDGGEGTRRPHSPDQQALGELIKEGTRGGRRLSDDDADTVLEWGAELFPSPPYGGVRDDRGTGHWIGGDHIHVPGASGPSHIPTTSN